MRIVTRHVPLESLRMGAMKGMLVRWLSVSGALVLGGVALSSCGAPRPNAYMSRISDVKLDILDDGYETFQRHCVQCHDQGVPVPRLGRYWHRPEMGLTLYTSLNDYERYVVVEYMRAVDDARLKMNWGALQGARLERMCRC